MFIGLHINFGYIDGKEPGVDKITSSLESRLEEYPEKMPYLLSGIIELTLTDNVNDESIINLLEPLTEEGEDVIIY